MKLKVCSSKGPLAWHMGILAVKNKCLESLVMHNHGHLDNVDDQVTTPSEKLPVNGHTSLDDQFQKTVLNQ